MKNKCLIIGGNGFIGKNLVLDLLKNNYEVIVYDIVTTNLKKSFLENQNLHYIEGDIHNTSYLTEQISDIEYIIWLIHTTVPATSMYDVEFDLISNIPPLIRFVQHLLHNKKAKKFIYLSSGGTVYGNTNHNQPIDEQVKKNPISSYGLTKLIAEEYLTFLTKESNLDTYILRPSNVYGRLQNLKKPQGIIGHIFNSILLNEPITIYGDGSITRDYIHVNDLTNAIIYCLKREDNEESPYIFNVGSGVPTTINDIIEIVELVSGLKVKINRMPQRKFDCNFNVLSIEKAQNILTWQPNIELKDGIKDVWNWLKNEF